QTAATAPEFMGKTDCRDPKVFPVQKNGAKVTLWGMALTGMGTGNIWFLKSTNLLDWTYAGNIKGFTNDPNINFRSECPDMAFITADDGSTRAVMTLTAREYLVGNIQYDEAKGLIQFIDLNGVDVSTLKPEEIAYQRMDFGPDSYATQSYYIDDEESEYYGKTISVSWFSGVPGGVASIDSGALQALRKVWNGGGVTIPVEWGLKKYGNKYLLTQTPIVKDSTAFEKTELFNETEITVTADGENILKNVNAKRFELQATVHNPNGENVAFRVGVGADEYTEIGWTVTDGYYVDRTHTSDGGLKMGNYKVKYTSGARSGDTQTFYILVDDGGVEVFCDDFSAPFYTLTFISPYSTGLSFQASGDVTVKELKINEIASVWNKGSGEETVLRVDKETVELDTELTTETTLTAYSTSGGEITYSVESGDDVIGLEETATGVKILAKKSGKATVKVVCGNAEKTVDVTVHGGKKDFDITFSKEGVVSGTWLMTAEGLVGAQSSGDGFILANETGADFDYTVKFNLGGGAAAAIMFRAAADMSDYYIANYDNNSQIVKLWTPYGELAN
ncbi:MAG: GH32 C-terminal domain-containing protein, partial [Clostridia bacterium]|nr:GH32 C-terminal domain-containing protein [Clostridia bacterium]